ncbi:bifunctional 4-hydroxy-2-oxoglutarate aldolase/2-dehydro-3-deoxy-phosphogluconate aldolase [Synechococcus sp. GFB01]|uniref:bifunctional 4-hydroxy-2-oxoglutarate aldolase/2-dehydro-3-deoxy-phosphogluconate aldolase n=1 Tax=Synechococcus sp. GFB01 TaxID=1662190 RepID=UPI00064F68CD|nr:bifunctional 4-hydroxy-2-oxoglutarate aldolase/2-dehydro-3-deoxy-phosphogluconate aldolase [Synechococcus sp. GFB01]KMM17190.1 2-dehydro-3-deoxyphosphogluconate aldolase [Synechococcus sp. GFB01]
MIAGLRRLPLLAVLRPRDQGEALPQLEALQAAGLRHVELAVNPSEAWVAMMRQLIRAFPQLHLGAASVRRLTDLEAAVAAGLDYAVSPIGDRELLRRATTLGITLVPGVFTPTELAQAIGWGARLVKLFPARAVGPGYWHSLSGPLGPLPFCIAAGGLGVDDVGPWLRAGVDAVALGSALFADHQPAPALQPGLASLIVNLQRHGYR